MTTATNDIGLLQALTAYIYNLSTVAGPLSVAADDLAATLPPNTSGIISGHWKNIADIRAVNDAIFTGVPGFVGNVTPTTAASYLASIANDLKQYDASLAQAQATQAASDQKIHDLQSQISTLNAQIGMLRGQTGIVKTGTPGNGTKTTPPGMPVTTLLAGIAVVLSIGAGAWYVHKQAKTKAKEAHKAGTFKPRLSAAAKENGAEEEETEEHAPRHARRTTRFTRRGR